MYNGKNNRMKLLLSLLVLLSIWQHAYADRVAKSENDYNDIFCHSLGGKRETRQYYSVYYVIVDCETDTHVIEGGLDKRSSIDSIQQAVFFSIITGKKPMVVIFDTDSKKGKYEIQIEAVANHLGIAFQIVE